MGTHSDQTSVTPMLKQYWQIKSEIEDKETILFFRLGDFYEMFFDDARIASELLDITLTSRNKSDANPVPLCGIPYHAAEGYISKLLSSGKKVAICEQVEDPKTAKGIVRREIIKIITPGVLMETDSLVAGENNYLAAINEEFALAICDVSTGDFRAAALKDVEHLIRELARIEPKEILVPRSLSESQIFLKLKPLLSASMLTVLDDPNFDPLVKEVALEGVPSEAYSSVGAVISYLKNTHKRELGHIKSVTAYSVDQHMVVDESTKRNLELTRTMSEASHTGSLSWLLDRTRTAMGGRTLRRWMLYPLLDTIAIDDKLDAVESIKDDFKLFEELKNDLTLIADIERITSRIVIGSANARELVSLKESLKVIPRLKLNLNGAGGLLGSIVKRLDDCRELLEKIEGVLVAEPPLSVKEGGLIKEGFSKELDELRSLATDGKGFIARLETSEKTRTGISSLKVRYNKVFGYYIEITHTHADKVPENYIRKQTLANAERFITPELKEYEEKVLGAEERIRQLEHELFTGVRTYAAEFAGRLAETADALGRLDALASLAFVANDNRYTRPVVKNDGEIKITGGRHPIIEKLNSTERFVPNDISLNMNDCRMMIITGPNMAGKSTIMRQTALIVLMAQMGSFVPASDASISVVDRIFTRVGASDNLVKGQSTFMVEMREASVILREATDKSLILIDEIGRGTSTYDGVSIAWAVAEYLHDRIKAKTLFATHYHELTDLALTKEGIKNFNVAVKEWNDQIIFLRKLVSGGVNRSYGIEVARLAGLPQEVVTRAKEILLKLEKGEMVLKGEETRQMGLFEGDSQLQNILKGVNLDTLTPIEALNVLHEMKNKL
ncbi:MAG: DNA mismatch repair protein MutS [Deltaproteobacteria bacterium CG11_big_fil_rev_8_21_14_0_20_49_13]|nr:MAG: DNA mismatch repair protein MutS [Deltaproteobacteria bacterium CG11_big_fil_rev_8_21_14_0_20_49_13]